MTLNKRRFNYSSLSLLLIGAQSVFLLIYAFYRPVDGDEGFYASAVKMVSSGHTVYKDFFYPQMPVLPYIYVLPYIVDPSLISLRIFSVFFGIVMMLLWFLYLRKEYDHKPEVIFITILLCSLSFYYNSWSVVFKSYALSNLLISMTLLSLYRFENNRNKYMLLISGLSLGILSSIRLLYAPLVFIFILWFLVTRKKLTYLLIFLIGLALGLVPVFLIVLYYPDLFYFNNYKYHILRDVSITLKQHFEYQRIFLMYLFKSSPYLVFLLITGLISVLSSVRKMAFDPFQNLFIVLIVSFFSISLIPFPAYIQYFTATIIPFILPLVASSVLIVFNINKKLAYILVPLAILIFSIEYSRNNVTNPENDIWRMETYMSISDFITSKTKGDDQVLSFWPGYVFESRRQYFPGMENHFGLRISSKITEEEHARYRIVQKKDIFNSIVNRKPAAVVVGAWMKDFYLNLDEYEKELFYSELDKGYDVNKEIDGVKIYLLRQKKVD